MIQYEPGNWSIMFAFSLKGSVFPKSFAWAAPCSFMAIVLHIAFRQNPMLMLVVGAGDVAAGVLSGFTFILGFLVVFRSSQAYNRWWEGGTLLQQLRGEWFNAYSCLLAFSTSNPDKAKEVRQFQHQIIRLFSLLYGCALQQASTLEDKKFELIELNGLEEHSVRFLQSCPDRCEVVLQWIQRLIVESDANGIIKIAPPILSRVFNELGNGIVNLNNARKIKEFPIPFPLAQMITVMLLFHAMVTPVICAATVETVYWAGIITFVVTFAYWSINYIAVELENPFGADANDLPLQGMQEDMNGSLKMLIREEAQRVPKFNFDPSHLLLKTQVIDFNADLMDYSEPYMGPYLTTTMDDEVSQSLPSQHSAQPTGPPPAAASGPTINGTPTASSNGPTTGTPTASANGPTTATSSNGTVLATPHKVLHTVPIHGRVDHTQSASSNHVVIDMADSRNTYSKESSAFAQVLHRPNDGGGGSVPLRKESGLDRSEILLTAATASDGGRPPPTFGRSEVYSDSTDRDVIEEWRIANELDGLEVDGQPVAGVTADGANGRAATTLHTAGRL